MTRTVWKMQASFYHLLRRNPVSALILSAENKGLRTLLKGVKTRSALDLGCGRGNSLKLLFDKTSFLVAVDNIYKMVHKNKDHFQGIKFITAEGHYLPFFENSFELICSIGLFEYLENWPDLLREIYRILVPEGYAVITISPPGFWNRLRLLLGHPLYFSKAGDFQKLITGSVPLFIVQHNRTLLQHQFLLQKQTATSVIGSLRAQER